MNEMQSVISQTLFSFISDVNFVNENGLLDMDRNYMNSFDFSNEGFAFRQELKEENLVEDAIKTSGKYLLVKLEVPVFYLASVILSMVVEELLKRGILGRVVEILSVEYLMVDVCHYETCRKLLLNMGMNER